MSVERSELGVERSGAVGAFIDRDNPWPGLASFTEDSRGFFFGRERETDELSRLVRRQTLTVLFGQSGLGKSSLLHAGLFPLLRESDYLPLYLRLDHAPSTPAPAEQVKAALSAAFAAAKADAPAFRADETLWEYFHRKDVDIWSPKNRLLTPVLAFDQFEEIFTLGRADEASRERSRDFLAELACLVENRAPAAVQAKLDSGELDPTRFNFAKPSCSVILSLREDFLPDLESLKQAMPALVHNRLRLKKLSGTQALEIVTRPAPHLLAEGVAEKIVEFVAGARGGSAERLAELDVEPPLLSVICRELNDRRRTLGQEKITADLVSGNRREILTDFYERSVADLPEAVRNFVEDHLLTKSGFRDNLALENALGFPGVTRPLIDTLVTRRLLRLEDRLGVQRVELTHDVLAEVIRNARDDRQRRLAAVATAQAARRQRVVIAGLAAAVALLGIGAVFGIRAQRRAEAAAQAEAARSSRTDLSYGSQLLEQGKAAEGLAYLARAARSDPHNYAVGPRLISALAYRAFALPVGHEFFHQGAVSATVSPDGRRLLSYSLQDRKQRQWDVSSGKLLEESEEYPADSSLLGFDNSRSKAIIVLGDGTIRVQDLTTGKIVLGPVRNGTNTLTAKISPDGRWLAAGNSEGAANLWDMQSGKLKTSLQLPKKYWVSSVDFSSDGTRLVATDFTAGWRVWAVPSGDPLSPIGTEFSAQVNFARFTPDGRHVLVGDNGGASFWDATTGKRVSPRMQGFRQGSFVAFLPDGSAVLSYSSGEQLVRIWEVPSGVLRHKFANGGVAALSRDGRRLLGVWADSSVHLVDASDGRALIEPIRSGTFVSASFSPSENEIWTGTNEGSVRQWRINSTAAAPLRLSASDSLNGYFLAEPRTLVFGVAGATESKHEYRDYVTGETTRPTLQFPVSVPTMSGSENGEFVAVVTDEGNSELWDLRQAPQIVRHPMSKGLRGSGRTLFSKNGRRVTDSLFGVRDIFVWDTDTGRVAGGPFRTVRNTSAQALDNQGQRLALGDTDGHVSVFDITSSKQVGEIVQHGSQIHLLVFSPDGTRLLSVNGGNYRLTDVASGRDVVPPIRLRSGPNSVAFSSDGSSILIPLIGIGELCSWDTQTGALRTLRLNTDKPTAGSALDANQSRIAVRDSLEGQLRIWSTATGQLVAEPLPLQGGTTRLRFSPDGRFLFTHGLVRTNLEIWPLPPFLNNTPVPAWMERLATAVAGGRIGASGEFQAMSVGSETFAALAAELAALPEDAPYAKWGRWFLADPATRTISPESPLTAAQAAKFFHEDPLNALIARDQMLRGLDRRAEAEVLERQIIALATKATGAAAQGASVQLQTIVDFLIRETRFGEAEPLARASLAIRERLTGRSAAANVANARCALGLAIAGQKRYKEAEEVLLTAYEEMKATRRTSASRMGEAAWALVRIYTATHQPEKAAEWQLRTETEKEP